MNIQLMKNTIWKTKSLPHCLVAGVSGSGKSMLVIYLIHEFKKVNSELFILDSKLSELYQLGTFLSDKHLGFDVESTFSVLQTVNQIMSERQQQIIQKKSIGLHAFDLGFSPILLVFDELGAFTAQLTQSKDKKEFERLFKNIILKGRSAGIICILTTQQPNSKNIPTEIRDQCSLKICLGRSTDIGTREMVFGGQTIDRWPTPPAKPYGVGWYSLEDNTIKIFEAPILKNFDINTDLVPLLKKG